MPAAHLNAIELGILTTERSADGLIHITLDVASRVYPEARRCKYDKDGDNHYDNDFRIYQKYAGI